jgi:nicotinate-nucleotide pyrophosphorylase (carboxylating)
LDPTKLLVQDALKSFFAEDLGYRDITTEALVNPRVIGNADIICKEKAVIAGLEEAKTILTMVGSEAKSSVRDGERVSPMTRVLQAKGPGQSLLQVERTLLNLLSHMSGVATATAQLVELANKSGSGNVRIACTRKTLPGLRYFEKKAVELGGGDTHRLRLDDAVLIKDNHLALAGTISDCVKTARAKVSFTKKIEVEVTHPSQAIEAARAGADIVLLDNMKPEQVKKTADLLQATGLRTRVTLEASGGIGKENLVEYAKAGVDVISVGRITQSAKSIDMSMEVSRSRAMARGR